jgi:cytochrome c oxidase subunit 2
MANFRQLCWMLGLIFLEGCADKSRSVLDPAGLQAQRIHREWWFFAWTCLAVYIWVLVVLLLAIARRRRAKEGAARELEPARERRMLHAVVAAVGLTVFILFAFLLIDLFTGRALAAMPSDPLKIKVVGHQWWWEIEYRHFPGEPDGGAPHGIFRTANEIHLPAGEPVLFELESRDVIHSFWVPSLHGKKDLIPGQHASMWLQADVPGTYMGQCAEYCGDQHSNMLLWVVAQPREEFQEWVRRQRQAAGNPAAERLARGRSVFLGQSCVICHTVEGTPARGGVAPNLTHVASRQRIAAGALDFSHENLSKWIRDPQSVKPGTRMPQHGIPAGDLDALVDWLETLK